MNYLKQLITDFATTNVPLRFSDYNPLTTYQTEAEPVTDVSVVRVGNYYYRTIVGNNIGNDPVETLGSKWIMYDVSNRYAMVDLHSATKTVTDGTDLIVTFPRGIIDTIAIGYYTASTLKVELLDVDDTTVLWTFEEIQSPNDEVDDYFTYMYSDYTVDYDRGRVISLPIFVGVTVRVTLGKELSSNAAHCGFLVAGESVFMGKTHAEVDFKFNSFSLKNTNEFGIISVTKRAVQDLVDFQTSIETSALQYNRRKIKSIYDEIVVFILDPSDTSIYENLITLGTITDTSIALKGTSQTRLAWSIQETI